MFKHFYAILRLSLKNRIVSPAIAFDSLGSRVKMRHLLNIFKIGENHFK